MNKPFYMLTGIIEKIKEIDLEDNKIERWYEDENGNRAILVMRKLDQKKI